MNFNGLQQALQQYFGGRGTQSYAPQTASAKPAGPALPPWQRINAAGQVENIRRPTDEELTFAQSAQYPEPRHVSFAMPVGRGLADAWLAANQRRLAQGQDSSEPAPAPAQTMRFNLDRMSL